MLGKQIYLLILFLNLPLFVFADDGVLVQKRIPVSEPLVIYGDVTTKLTGLKVAFDSENGRYFLMDSTKVYTFNIGTRSWEYLSELDYEFLKFRIDYSKYHDGLLFWDQGVGRVFLMDSTKTLTRLDKSFNQNNQFGHASWIHPETGTIYAFGGYGLFRLKSLLTRYVPNKQEWNETPIRDPRTWPAPQLLSSSFPDMLNNKVYILGSKLTQSEYFSRNYPIDEKSKNAFWEYDIPTSSWSRLADLPEYLHGPIANYKNFNLTNYSVHPDLSFLLFSREGDISSISSNGLHVFDIASKAVKKVADIEPKFSDLETYLNINWSSEDNVFYVLSVEFNYNLRRVIIHPYTIELKDETTFISRLRSQDETSTSNASLIIAILLVSIPIGTWLTYWNRTQRKRKQGNSISNHERFVITLDHHGNIQLNYKGESVEALPDGEMIILNLLARNSLQDGAYLASDEIENALLPSHPSQDYVRRFRNLTMDRLVNYLSTYCDENQEFILKRPTVLDKRKFEYRLNEACFKVEYIEKVTT